MANIQLRASDIRASLRGKAAVLVCREKDGPYLNDTDQIAIQFNCQADADRFVSAIRLASDPGEDVPGWIREAIKDQDERRAAELKMVTGGSV